MILGNRNAPASVATTTRAKPFNHFMSLYNEAAAASLRAKVSTLTNGGLVRLVAIGDSATTGVGGGGRRQSWVSQLASRLDASPSISITGWWHGLNPQAGWVNDSRFGYAGGVVTNRTDHAVTLPSGASVTFTSDFPSTAIDVHYAHRGLLGATVGAFTVEVDGGAPVTVTPSGANALGVYSLSGLSSAAHTVTITGAGSGADAFVFGLGEYSSRTSGLHVINGGIVGSKASDWQTDVWLFQWAQTMSHGVDVAIISLGVNDATGPDVGAFKTRMTDIVAHTRALTPAVGLLVEAPPTNAAWPTYVGAQYDLADSLDLPLWDATSRFLSRDIGGALGLYADVTHPSAQGYAAIAAMVAQSFTAYF